MHSTRLLVGPFGLLPVDVLKRKIVWVKSSLRLPMEKGDGKREFPKFIERRCREGKLSACSNAINHRVLLPTPSGGATLSSSAIGRA